MNFALNFEEMTALRQGVGAFEGETMALEALLDEGEAALGTLAEQARLEDELRAVVGYLLGAMDREVMATHPADEGAVAAYFDYAHALSALHRVEETGAEMRALFGIIEGRDPADFDVETFVFPD